MWNKRAKDIALNQSQEEPRLKTALAANQSRPFSVVGLSCYQSWDNVIYSCFSRFQDSWQNEKNLEVKCAPNSFMASLKNASRVVSEISF